MGGKAPASSGSFWGRPAEAFASWIEIAANLEFLAPAKRHEIQECAAEVGRIINGLLASFR